jgi:hypothetical protein
VTTSPNTSDQPHSGSTPTSAASPCAETADWMPNQPTRLIPIASPISADPDLPNPVQRASMEVDIPSRIPMMPTKTATTSRMTAPRVSATNASQNPIPKPSVAPSRNWLSAETWPNR